MAEKSIYDNFGVDDFVEDKKFRDWIFSPDEGNRLFWERYIKENQKKQGAIKIARQITEAVYFEEKPLGSKEYGHSLGILKEKIAKRNKSRKKINMLPYWWGKIAAILIIPFIAASIYLYFNMPETAGVAQTTQYIAPPGQKSKLALADGTNIWLNSGSKLTYTMGNGMGRKVYLEGEAYFDVAKNKKAPFLVETGRYTVKVYGTKFNVRAFEGQPTSEVILEEGSVSVLAGSNKEIKLKPNQRFYINGENKYQVGDIEPGYYTCWKDNVLRINNEELQHLIVRLERWYGVSITVRDFEKVKKLRYTLTIKTESCKEMLELMRVVTPFSYSISGENITINYKP